MLDKSVNKASEPAKPGIGLGGPDRRQDLQDKLVSDAERIRQALGKRAANL
jgi:hypothetical protein